MPKGIPLTEEEQERRRREIVDAAVGLFVEKGFSETSMREIGLAAGMGKSSLYDYFKTKDEVLLQAIQGWIADLASEAREIAGQAGAVPDRLKLIMRKNLEYLVQKKSLYAKLGREAQRLGAASREHIKEQRHAYQDVISALIEEGIADGSLRRVNPIVAARTLIFALSPNIFSSRPSGSPDQIFDDLMDLILRGIQAGA